MNLFWIALLGVAATAAAVAAMLTVRRGAPDGGYFADGDRASGVFGVLATGFSVLLGLVVVLAFNSYDTSKTGAETEALTVAQQFETAQFLPASVGPRLGGELICYGRTVAYQQWPKLQDGTLTEALNPWSVSMFRTLKVTRPTTPTEETAYSKWVDQTVDRGLAVNDRVHGAEGVIPVSLWVVLFVIASIIVIYVLFFADSGERRVVQSMLMGSVVAVISVTLMLIWSLDRPYQATVGGLQPVAMERALRTIDQERRVVGRAAPPPCTATGVPLVR